MAFANHHPEFQKLNRELIGVSIDRYHVQVAQVRLSFPGDRAQLRGTDISLLSGKAPGGEGSRNGRFHAKARG